jgi:hypothetical protein
MAANDVPVVRGAAALGVLVVVDDNDAEPDDPGEGGAPPIHA